MSDYIIVGAGITGATIARILAESGKKITVLEREEYIGGACHDVVMYGIPVCQFGIHIFHTNNNEVWNFINRFSEFYPYEHRAIANSSGDLYTLPINLLTLNKLFGIKNVRQAKEYFENLPFVGEDNFEEVAISRIGQDLYQKFFYGYTTKQWGMEPKNISANIFGRLPIRLNADTRYFSDKYQGMPRNGYDDILRRMLDHKNIYVKLNSPYEGSSCGKLIYTGSIDEFHKYCYGELEYRSVSHHWIVDDEDAFGSAHINYVSLDEDFTRILTFNHLYPHLDGEKFISAVEYVGPYNKPTGRRHYPISTNRNLTLYEKYKKIKSEVIFSGRLGGYKYINMDVAVREAINLARSLL